MKQISFTTITLLCLVLLIAIRTFAGGGSEYTGTFDNALVPNVEEYERVIFKYSAASPVKGAIDLPEDAHLAVARLLDPRTQQYTVLALLVETKDKDPIIYVDSDGDNSLSPEEKFQLRKQKPDDPYLWIGTPTLKMKDGPFTTCPIFVRYFRSVRAEKMGPEDRLLTQSTEVLARGNVSVEGKKITVQYAYDTHTRKVDPQNGWLGMDLDEDGEIDMDNLSPEAARADNESVVFRVGDRYLSTKKADIAKNQIVLREHEAKDYKRIELFIGKELPDFGFTDFDGKKHKLSEYRGKFVLLDIWGFWCPPCRKELPYLRDAFRRFQTRNLIVVGINTDPDYTVDSMKKALSDNGMTWTQGQLMSVASFLSDGIRVNSFPTTFLISPEGKIISMGRSERGEPDLRGSDLLETLDETLPKQ